MAGGSGRLLLLTGPGGAGKTRRAGALAEEAARSGFTVAWAAGGRPGAPAYWPWLQVLRSVSRLDAETARVHKVLATGEAGSSGADRRARFELFEEVLGGLGRAAEQAPLVVVLDDLHDDDSASLLLTQHLAAVIRSVPVLLVATVRTDVVPDTPEWPQVWGDLVRHGEVVGVGPLGEDEVARLLREATGSADPALVHRIRRRTGGNALFVTELVRWYAASGGEADALPDTVLAVIGARVAERSPACRRVLSAAATLGSRAGVDLVVDILAESLGDVLAAVGEATRHGLLDGADPEQVAFTHEIVRDAVYDAQPPAHRAHWHRVVAERLASSGDATGSGSSRASSAATSPGPRTTCASTGRSPRHSPSPSTRGTCRCGRLPWPSRGESSRKPPAPWPRRSNSAGRRAAATPGSGAVQAPPHAATVDLDEPPIAPAPRWP